MLCTANGLHLRGTRAISCIVRSIFRISRINTGAQIDKCNFVLKWYTTIIIEAYGSCSCVSYAWSRKVFVH